MKNQLLGACLVSTLGCSFSLLVADRAYAQVSLVSNGSFESNNLGTNAYLYGGGSGTAATASPWTFSSTQGSGIATPSTSGFSLNGTVANGSDFAFVRNSTMYPGGTISQSNFVNTGSYLLTFYEAGRSNPGTNSGDGSSSYTVGLTGSTGALTLTDVLGISHTSPAQNTTTAGQVFTEVQYRFDVVSAGTYNLLFSGVSSTGASASFLDNVSIVAVPEAATWLGGALLLGITGIIIARRRFGQKV